MQSYNTCTKRLVIIKIIKNYLIFYLYIIIKQFWIHFPTPIRTLLIIPSKSFFIYLISYITSILKK